MHSLFTRHPPTPMIWCLLLGALNGQAEYRSIFESIREGDPASVRQLLEEDPTLLEATDGESYETPAWVALYEGKLEPFKVLVEFGYPLNPNSYFEHPISKLSPFLSEAGPDHMELMQWILDQVTVPPGILDRVLHEFVKSDHTVGAEILLVAGANPNGAIKNGRSCLDQAESPEMKALLKQYGAKRNYPYQWLTEAAIFSLCFLGIGYAIHWILLKLQYSRSRLLISLSLLIFVSGSLVLFLFTRQLAGEIVDEFTDWGWAIALGFFKLLPLFTIIRCGPLALRLRQLSARSGPST